MMQSVIRFACDNERCRDAKPFETPEELAYHFRDQHLQDELKTFVGAVVLQDYQRLVRRTAVLESRATRSMPLLVRRMLTVAPANESQLSRSRSRSPRDVD